MNFYQKKPEKTLVSLLYPIRWDVNFDLSSSLWRHLNHIITVVSSRLLRCEAVYSLTSELYKFLWEGILKLCCLYWDALLHTLISLIIWYVLGVYISEEIDSQWPSIQKINTIITTDCDKLYGWTKQKIRTWEQEADALDQRRLLWRGSIWAWIWRNVNGQQSRFLGTMFQGTKTRDLMGNQTYNRGVDKKYMCQQHRAR